MSRILTTENAKVVREYVSPLTTIRWEPQTNTGVLTYNVNELLYINDEFIQMMPKTSVTLPIEQLVNRDYEIEVAEGVSHTVNGGLIMLAFKKAFELALQEGKIFPPDPEPIEPAPVDPMPVEPTPVDPAPSDTIVPEEPVQPTQEI